MGLCDSPLQIYFSTTVNGALSLSRMPLINTTLTLKDLPPPPPGKTGWPWTEPTNPLPERMPDGSEWPRISIVTPSYNYGRFIEETIRSVLLQGYPNLEYIVIDGGSTDNTIEIIRKYDKYLTYWVSEPDEGQTDAINKGYQHCIGELFAWLNADDIYAHSTCLKNISEFYKKGYKLIVGECNNIDINGNKIIIKNTFNGYCKPQYFDQYVKFWSFVPMPEPAVFIAKELTDKSFPLDKNLYTTMDYQLFLRVLSQQPKSVWIKQTWVNFKYHGNNKTMQPISDAYLELYKVSLSEATRVYKFIKRKLFKVFADDYLTLVSIMSRKTPASFGQILMVLATRPTLMGWSLSWKLLIKACIGSKKYLKIKQVAYYFIKG